MSTLDIGVLVLMHDKQATQQDFIDALGPGVRLHWFHPVSHPLHQPPLGSNHWIYVKYPRWTQ